ncbi:hypothetical protein C8F04DRAFT_1235346, partial [Mycena alexandri]
MHQVDRGDGLGESRQLSPKVKVKVNPTLDSPVKLPEPLNPPCKYPPRIYTEIGIESARVHAVAQSCFNCLCIPWLILPSIASPPVHRCPLGPLANNYRLQFRSTAIEGRRNPQDSRPLRGLTGGLEREFKGFKPKDVAGQLITVYQSCADARETQVKRLWFLLTTQCRAQFLLWPRVYALFRPDLWFSTLVCPFARLLNLIQMETAQNVTPSCANIFIFPLAEHTGIHVCITTQGVVSAAHRPTAARSVDKVLPRADYRPAAQRVRLHTDDLRSQE